MQYKYSSPENESLSEEKGAVRKAVYLQHCLHSAPHSPFPSLQGCSVQLALIMLFDDEGWAWLRSPWPRSYCPLARGRTLLQLKTTLLTVNCLLGETREQRLPWTLVICGEFHTPGLCILSSEIWSWITWCWTPRATSRLQTSACVRNTCMRALWHAPSVERRITLPQRWGTTETP